MIFDDFEFNPRSAIMSSPLGELKPAHLWKYFEAILKIPHCSGNEKGLAEYILSVAGGLGLEAKRDKVGNVIVRKTASAGREKLTGIILQSHMDMVGEKNSDVVHDFARDPIKASVKGEWVQAEGTTLGADNGIGIAASLAVMEEKSLVHGPLEFLFTVDEETGLTGANKLEKGVLRGKYLLNLDSEEEGTFTIGCAGGADSVITLSLKRKVSISKNVYMLKISGLRGGHSGLDIHQGRGNAIKLLARMLRQARLEHRFELVGIEGGNKRNAIPREAWAVIGVDPAGVKALAAFFKKAFEEIRVEYQSVETGLKYVFEKAAAAHEAPINAEGQKALLDLLIALPHGVVAMHPEIPGLTETSTNLAIVRCEKKQAQIVCSTRSSIASALEATRNVLEAVCELSGARIQLQDGYPGWMPNLQSALLAKLQGIYKAATGNDARVVAVHAGLECGIIGEKYPGMDMISFGPTLEHPHSPDERVHVGSVEKFWKFMASVLSGLA
jgi:dipeptidase D